jgi:hypothetical protein
VSASRHLSHENFGLEAVKTSEIEGEILNRDSVHSSLRHQFGLGVERPRESACWARRARSVRQDDKIRADAGLGAQALIGNDEGRARRHELGDALDGVLRDRDAIECVGRA